MTDIVITIQGGIITGIVSRNPISALVVDYDCNEEPDGKRSFAIPQGDNRNEPAWVSEIKSEVDSSRVAEFERTIR